MFVVLGMLFDCAASFLGTSVEFYCTPNIIVSSHKIYKHSMSASGYYAYIENSIPITLKWMEEDMQKQLTSYVYFDSWNSMSFSCREYESYASSIRIT